MNNIDNSFSDDAAQSQGLVQSLIAKVINNVQVTVKNIHIRYEDSISVPGVRSSVHPRIISEQRYNLISIPLPLVSR